MGYGVINNRGWPRRHYDPHRHGGVLFTAISYGKMAQRLSALDHFCLCRDSTRARIHHWLGHGDGLHLESSDLYGALQQAGAKYPAGHALLGAGDRLRNAFYTRIFEDQNFSARAACCGWNIDCGGCIFAFVIPSSGGYTGQHRFFPQPFYSTNFRSFHGVTSTSIAVLTYIGTRFPIVGRVENPRRNVMLRKSRAGVRDYGCFVSLGFMPLPRLGIEAFSARHGWSCISVSCATDWRFFSSTCSTSQCSSQISGQEWARSRQLGCFTGWAVATAFPRNSSGHLGRSRIPRNNVIFVGAIALVRAFLISYGEGNRAAEFWGAARVYGRERSGIRSLLLTLKQLDQFRFSCSRLFICLFIWHSLGPWAIGLGTVWMAVGLRTVPSKQGLQDRFGAI
jgi:hypothetical protein